MKEATSHTASFKYPLPYSQGSLEDSNGGIVQPSHGKNKTNTISLNILPSRMLAPHDKGYNHLNPSNFEQNTLNPLHSLETEESESQPHEDHKYEYFSTNSTKSHKTVDFSNSKPLPESAADGNVNELNKTHELTDICWNYYPSIPWSIDFYFDIRGAECLHLYLWVIKDLSW